MTMIPNKNKKKNFVFNVRNPSQETALKLFDVLPVVGWDDLYREWLERQKNLRSNVQRYRFAQYLGQSLHYNSSEIRTNSVALRQFDRMLASRVNSIIREIQETRARNEIASITVWVRSLKEVRVILSLN
ncbi:hypothetical protein BDQ94DRAFT_164722 [Aspergillus welwitschiae]|uniref:Uncharacterized protein n=1 Tax=Aspergillus welwitschiae TaxID=1341132 RepID=A0A3F3PGV2_9EURO|nr:hypothetical protein BDQ94DRAFT_164722 [Aspergillus welwitschiae]RDH26154.1 hypothetical protein BDQ94DRAFT_164722 [Aspergillus welwitschiae]